MLQLWARSGVRRFLRQGKCDVNAARPRLGIFAAACGYDHELAAVYFVSGGGGGVGEGEGRLPKQLTGGFFEGGGFFFVVVGAGKKQPAPSDGSRALLLR